VKTSLTERKKDLLFCRQAGAPGKRCGGGRAPERREEKKNSFHASLAREKERTREIRNSEISHSREKGTMCGGPGGKKKRGGRQFLLRGGKRETNSLPRSLP